MYEGKVMTPSTDLKNFPFDVDMFGIKFCTISDFMTFDDSSNGECACTRMFTFTLSKVVVNCQFASLGRLTPMHPTRCTRLR